MGEGLSGERDGRMEQKVPLRERQPTLRMFEKAMWNPSCIMVLSI